MLYNVIFIIILNIRTFAKNTNEHNHNHNNNNNHAAYSKQILWSKHTILTTMNDLVVTVVVVVTIGLSILFKTHKA